MTWVRRVVGRLRDAVRWLLATEEEIAAGAQPREAEQRAEEMTPQLRRFRARVAIAIVIVSVCSALTAWRASVFEEYSVQHEGLFRQELAGQLEREQLGEAQVAHDLQAYARFEQDQLLASRLRRDAVRSPGGRARALVGELQAARRWLIDSFGAFSVGNAAEFSDDGTSSYDPANAYKTVLAGDLEFLRFEPGVQRLEARRDRGKAADLVGVTALFVAALVLLTLSEVSLGRRSRRGQRSRQPEGDSWSIRHSLATLGVATAVLAAVLFGVTYLS